MTTTKFLTEQTTSKLMDYQIQKISYQIKDYIQLNEELDQYHFDVCPKCGKVHPRLTKGGFSNSGKQMLRCQDCGKRFVVDRGQLTFYSHQSSAQWNDLITDTLDGKSLLHTAAKLDVHEITVFRMRHKFMKFLEDEVSPICPL